MTLEQDIEFLKMMTFNSIEDLNNNTILQKYFDIKDNGQGVMEHIFKGFQIENGCFNGYHSECLYPNLYNHIINTSLKIDKTKVYEMYLYDVSKKSSFFPITMSCEEIIIAILEEYKQKIKNKSEKNIIKNHLKIEIFLTNEGKIYNAYPIYNARV